MLEKEGTKRSSSGRSLTFIAYFPFSKLENIWKREWNDNPRWCGSFASNVLFCLFALMKTVSLPLLPFCMPTCPSYCILALVSWQQNRVMFARSWQQCKPALLLLLRRKEKLTPLFFFFLLVLDLRNAKPYLTPLKRHQSEDFFKFFLKKRRIFWYGTRHEAGVTTSVLSRTDKNRPRV